MDLKNIYGEVLFSAAVDTINKLVVAALRAEIDLQYANLQYADLQGADLRSANLQYANLQGADLQYADLQGADLRSANLQGANLQGADLQYADLQGANLQGANLQYADLRSANLQGANLQGADLQYADLRSANLRSATITNSILPKNFPVARLDFGNWSILVTTTHTSIGCQTHPNKDWLRWTPKDVKSFADGAELFWKQHQKAVKAVIKDVQARAPKSVL